MQRKLLIGILSVVAAVSLTVGIAGCSNGLSAYEIAVEHGFEGTEEEWLESLRGEDGQDGAPGADGQDGQDGQDGEDGATPTIEINEDGYWVINGEVTDVKAEGQDGQDGQDGAQGPQGPEGERGSKWFYGAGTPAAEVTGSLLEGDMYYCTTNNTIWYYENEAWTIIASLTGENVTTVEDPETLADMVNEAGENGTVVLGDGTYDFTNITLPEGISIMGNGETVVDMSDGYTLSSDNVTLTGLNIAGNSEGGDGSSTINITGDNATITDCVFTNGPQVTYSGHIIINNTASNVVIENSTFSGSFRAIYVYNADTVTIRNCHLDATYPINVSGASACTLVVEDTELLGWTSYSLGEGTATFTGCTFGTGTSGYSHLRPYDNTTFTNCTFTEDMTIDTGAAVSVEFESCTYGDGEFDITSLLTMAQEAITSSDVFYEYTLASTWVIDGVTYDLTATYIFDVEDLTAFATAVNGGTTYEGETVVLAADIDLANVAWTPIGEGTTNYFQGTFDGAGHTISNLTVESNDYAGLFGYVDTATIKNFTLENVNASGGDHVAAAVGDLYRGTAEDITVTNATLSGNHYVGAITGYSYGNIENCSVDGLEITVTPNETETAGTYDNGDKAGGIVGWKGSGIITGCSVKNATISAFRDLGGIVGNVQKDGADPVITNNAAENVTLSYVPAPGTMVGGSVNGNMGAIIGRYASDVAEMTISGNTVTNVTITATPETAQSVLDNLLGGETVVFAAGEYGDLELGQSRARSTATTNADPATDIAISDLADTGVYRYSRTVEDVTLVGSEGAVFTGTFLIRSGHVYDSDASDEITYTDPVRNVALSGTNTSYYSYMYVDGITFSDMNFEGLEGVINGRFYIAGAYLKNITIADCTFTAPDYSNGGTTPVTGQTAINLMTDLMDTYENITITGNAISNYFQGVYVQNGNGMTVSENTISGTVHNAIAVQNGGNAGTTDPDPDYFTGIITISDNIISNTGDRAIRFGIGQDATITVSGNTFTNAADSDGEVLKAETLTDCTHTFTDNTYTGGTMTESADQWIVSVTAE